MKIIYENKEMDVEEGSKVKDILKEKINNSDKRIIACMVNNEVKSLDFKINKESRISLIDFTHKDGKRIYIRGLLYIMGKAFSETYKDALLTVDYQLNNAMLCEVDNMEVTDEMIERVRNKMFEIVQKDIPIIKKEMTKEEAEEFYNREKTLKGKLQLDLRDNKDVTVYYCEDYFNYFYGVMPQSTGYIKVFDIIKYRDGFLIRYPSKDNPDQLGEYKEFNKLIETLDDYEKLHRILNVNTIYKLNTIVNERKEKECILVDEALHEKRIIEIANQIKQRKNTKVILIAGPSSSGKTTFAKRLGIQLRLNGLKPVTISVDNYFLEREETPKDEFGKYDFESINAIDLKLFNDHLRKLIAGETILAPTFDFITGRKVYKGNTMSLSKDEVLVIEGIHCLNDELTNEIDKNLKFKIYISALTVLNIDYYNRISTTDTRLIRRIVRDYNFRGYSAYHTLSMWDSVNRGENKNIFPYQEQADAMFNSSLVYELGILRNYTMPLLLKIDNYQPEYSEAKRLYRLLSYFEPINPKFIPNQSLLREFIGGSVFEY